MADVLSSNVFALLDDENEDPQQLVKAAAKAAPPPKAADAPKPLAGANAKTGALIGMRSEQRSRNLIPMQLLTLPISQPP